jgi:putative ABC transport system substrate-binding protein
MMVRVIVSRTRCAMKKAGLSSILIAVVLLAVGVIAEAQQPKKISRVGFIGASSASSGGHYLEAFRHGLRDLGYVEGEDIVIEVRWAEGSAGRFPHLIAELIGLKVDVLFVSSAPGALAAKNAGITTPVVFATVTTPSGMASSRASLGLVAISRVQHWR